MSNYYDRIVLESATSNINKIKYDITSVCLNDIYPMVSESLSKNLQKFKACVGRFISKKSTQLYDTGPNDRIFFGKEEREDFFKSMGFTDKDITAKLKNTYYWDINFSPIAAKDPFTITMMMVVRYFYIKKMDKELELAGIYLAFSGKFYASVHYNSFPRVVPGEHKAVMDYVINYKLTQKFDIKKEGSVFGAVRALVITWIGSYSDKLKEPNDEDVAYLIDQLYNRLKSFMKNIAREYYDAYENKDYLNFESDSNEEESFRVTDNNSLMAVRYTENTINLMTTQSINYKFCTMAADQNVKKDEIKDIMESVIRDNVNMSQLKDVINILITDYMRAYPMNKGIEPMSFLSYSLKAKPNTKDKDILRLKSTIESWLDENSPNYRKRKNREATKNSYYRSILKYIVLSINNANK